MLGRILAATAGTVGLLGGVAFAQSSPKDSSPKDTGTQSQSPLPGDAPTTEQATHSIPHEIRETLTQEGFSDVKIVPGSYLVTAKDKNGDPVTMIIGPNSMTMFSVNKGTREQAEAPELKQ
jgi:hypothetical protein